MTNLVKASNGIIPARAGFTTAATALPPSRRDHPRTRGVYLRRRQAPGLPHRDHPLTRGVYTRLMISMETTSGSSPHARGLLPGALRAHDDPGIIPARAGFTILTNSGAVIGDGEGSSPHARGLRQRGSTP